GSGIGLGAIWKGPYMTGMSGGGAFFIIFIMYPIFIGLPILLDELLISRGSKKDAVSAHAFFALRSGWPAIRIIGRITSFILLSFYSVVGGWILLFIYEPLVCNLSGLSEAEYGAFFDNTIANSGLALGSQFLFMIIAIVVVARGVQKGIEKASKIMMPALF